MKAIEEILEDSLNQNKQSSEEFNLKPTETAENVVSNEKNTQYLRN